MRQTFEPSACPGEAPRSPLCLGWRARLVHQPSIMARPATDLRERALAAAIAIASRDGAGSMSIDAVAREAGVSKGGVLHHFPSKEALVLEVVRHLTAQFAAAVEAEAERDLEPVGRYVRAFLRALADPNLVIVGRAMLSAVAHDLSLLERASAMVATHTSPTRPKVRSGLSRDCHGSRAGGLSP